MNETAERNIYSKDNQEITLFEIINILWNKKIYIVALTFIFSITAALYALNLPNIYKSSALLMPQQNESSMSSMLGRYSGMASLAGIRLPSESSTKSQEAMTRIQSFEFFSDHVYPFIASENLFAARGWNKENNEIVYDESIYNAESGKWLYQKPSVQDSFNAFNSTITISEDLRTSFVRISVDHVSPYVAQRWNKFIIDKIDKVMRNEDKEDTKNSIEYLNSINATIKNEEIRKSLSMLQQDQMKQLMVLEANKNYVFKVLDSPVIPERRSEPSRTLIVAIGTIIGAIFSMILFISLHFIQNKKQ